MEASTILEAHFHVVPRNIWKSEPVIASDFDIVPVQLVPKDHLFFLAAQMCVGR